MGGSYSEAAQTLARCLGLVHAPVAVSFSDSIPAGVSKYADRAPAGCRFWQEASVRTFATSAADHEMCAIGVYTHNLAPSLRQQTDLKDALAVFGELGYVRSEDLPGIPVLSSRADYVIYGPLAESHSTPDVVLLFVKASQLLILSEATQQVEAQNAPAMGRPACAVIPQVVNSGRAALSLGCCGARAYLDVLTDDIALFAIPGDKLPLYVQRIETLAQANATLSRFHELRRGVVEAGQTPTIQESLAALTA